MNLGLEEGKEEVKKYNTGTFSKNNFFGKKKKSKKKVIRFKRKLVFRPDSDSKGVKEDDKPRKSIKFSKVVQKREILNFENSEISQKIRILNELKELCNIQTGQGQGQGQDSRV